MSSRNSRFKGKIAGKLVLKVSASIGLKLPIEDIENIAQQALETFYPFPKDDNERYLRCQYQGNEVYLGFHFGKQPFICTVWLKGERPDCEKDSDYR